MKSQLPQLKPRVQLPSIAGKRRAGGAPARGEITFAIPGTHTWIVPNGVTSVSSVCVGGGSMGGGNNIENRVYGGGGGALAYVNNVKVSAGEIITVVVGAGGLYRAAGGRIQTTWLTIYNGQQSYFKETNLCRAGGSIGGLGIAPAGGVVLAGTGGAGGAGVHSILNNGVASGAGAGGYSGTGGAAVAAIQNVGTVGNDGSGGAGGSGAVSTNASYATSGGGVGLFGEGASGLGAATATPPYSLGGGGGSGGQDGEGGELQTNNDGLSSLTGGLYGGGGNGFESKFYAGNGGHGAVRIIWGPGREFPSTDVGQS